MSVNMQLAHISDSATTNTTFLIAAQSIMSNMVIPEKRRFGTQVYTGTMRMHNWWNLEHDRIARPHPVKMNYINFKQDMDHKTFTTELSGVYLLYDMIFSDYDTELPILEYDDVDSILIDIYASALYSIAVLTDVSLYTMYLSAFFSLMQLKELEVVKPNFKPVSGARMAPSVRF